MNNKLKIQLDRQIICILSFLIPLVTLIVMMVVEGVEPFGDNSLLIIDGLHQYMPFFSILYDKLKSGGSLFYSFRTGLGINFLALYSYYLSSPMNLLILLFQKTQLNMAVSFLIVIKLALSGLTASLYFNTKVKDPSPAVVMVSVAYALNAYMVGYCWNVMWLDAIMIFPIVILGIERLIEKQDGRMYALALFYALYCNYYIAFMICIFAVIWYLLYHFKNFSQFFTRGFAFAGWSFLSAGMAAALLLPAYAGIKQTASGDAMMLPNHSWLTNFWNLISRQYDLSTPITHDNFDGNANLYVGCFAILCLLLYLLNKEIKLISKLKYMALVVFFYMSFNEMVLNFIWHGFHDEYGIPNRFSFLFCFVLLCMVLELFEHKEAIQVWQAVLSCLICVGVLVLSRNYVDELMEEGVYGLIGMMFVIYTMLLFFMCIDKRHKEWHATLFCMVAVVEIIVSAVNGFTNNGQISVSKYFYGTEDMKQATDAMKARNADHPFYRSELAATLMVDENAWYDLKAIGLFGSTAMAHTVDIMDSLGFYTGCNEYLYRGGNPVTNAMFGVKYLYYHQADTMMTNFDFADQYGTFAVYENPIEELSIGYAIDEYIDNWNYTSDYPFTVLNDFCYQGYDKDPVFEKIEIPEPVVKGCSVENTNDGEYRFDFKEADVDNLVFTLPPSQKDQDLYIFYDGTQVENVNIAVNGNIVRNGDLDSAVQMVKGVNQGDQVTVSMELKGENMTGYIRLSAAGFRQDLFDEMVERMEKGAVKVDSMTDTHIVGQVEVEDSQHLFFSIPYDEGWKVKIDGEEAELMTIGDAFLGAYVEPGTHDVELTYVPMGFSLGWKLSLASWLIFIAIFIMSPKIQSQRTLIQTRREEEKAKKLEEEMGFPSYDTISEEE